MGEREHLTQEQVEEFLFMKITNVITDIHAVYKHGFTNNESWEEFRDRLISSAVGSVTFEGKKK